MKKKKAKILVSPIGVARWPSLLHPDTRYAPKGENGAAVKVTQKKEGPRGHAAGIQYGTYKVDLALEGRDAEDFKAQIDELMDEAVASASAGGKNTKRADPPYGLVMDKNGEPTGETYFRFKLERVSVTDAGEWVRRVGLFDSSLYPIENIDIGAGSEIIVTSQPWAWTASGNTGVKLQIQSVQLIKYVPRPGGEGPVGLKKQDGFTAAEEFNEVFNTPAEVADDGDF